MNSYNSFLFKWCANQRFNTVWTVSLLSISRLSQHCLDGTKIVRTVLKLSGRFKKSCEKRLRTFYMPQERITRVFDMSRDMFTRFCDMLQEVYPRALSGKVLGLCASGSVPVSHDQSRADSDHHRTVLSLWVLLRVPHSFNTTHRILLI